MSEFFCEVCGKLGAVIRDDFVKESKMSVELAENDGCNFMSCGHFLCWAQNYPLTEAMVYHNQEGIKAI